MDKMKMRTLLLILPFVLSFLLINPSAKADLNYFRIGFELEAGGSYEYYQPGLDGNYTFKFECDATGTDQNVDLLIKDEMGEIFKEYHDFNRIKEHLYINDSKGFTFTWYNQNQNEPVMIDCEFIISPTGRIHSPDIYFRCSKWTEPFYPNTTMNLTYDFSAMYYMNYNITMLYCLIEYDFIQEKHMMDLRPDGLLFDKEPENISYSKNFTIWIEPDIKDGYHWMNITIVYEANNEIVFEQFFTNTWIDVPKLDSDWDGWPDVEDEFPYDSTEHVDSDNDTYGDNIDAFPDDPSEWADSDGDGKGDNIDEFPEDPRVWKDTDGDGYADPFDHFHLDPAEWNDTDNDGVGDNTDAFPDDHTEWIDSDLDGIGDNKDKFPFDQNEWRDSDGDKIGDLGDAFPDDPAASVDTDGDGYPDSWNPGNDETDSTTGLVLDEYPHDPDRWEEEEAPVWLILVVMTIVLLVIVVIIGIFLYIAVKSQSSDHSTDREQGSTSTIVVDVRKQIQQAGEARDQLKDDPLKDFERELEGYRKQLADYKVQLEKQEDEILSTDMPFERKNEMMKEMEIRMKELDRMEKNYRERKEELEKKKKI